MGPSTIIYNLAKNNVNTYNKDTNNSKGFVYETSIQNNQQQDFNESVNRALDQTKDNINRSIQESKNRFSL